MGSCLSSRERSRPSSADFQVGSVQLSAISMGKNQALRNEPLKWKSEAPITEGQLRSQRAEFWDTAPAFEGRREIWDALRAASVAAEGGDYALAQAIVDGANISLPGGTLLDCYDELGNRYQLPIYCLCSPINLVEDTSSSLSDSPSPESEPYLSGEELIVKVRTSTQGPDMRLALRTGETILHAKRRLQATIGVDSSNQRWFFGGKLLQDKQKISETKLQFGHVVQVALPHPVDQAT
ncbi:ubiquitin domain-containing protein 1-like [Tropilaelaps mercedesae]|uniref:Ubiquitin domain-containing protein 1-like n=1 Tax=Tropilaelaps mercedesae TaxID=418985 RepID=A0A1V9XDA0_9ACAR|nr:ubiquitin domain-containing protein 1-like [Tropilaelaps mercedesae]